MLYRQSLKLRLWILLPNLRETLKFESLSAKGLIFTAILRKFIFWAVSTWKNGIFGKIAYFCKKSSASTWTNVLLNRLRICSNMTKNYKFYQKYLNVLEFYVNSYTVSSKIIGPNKTHFQWSKTTDLKIRLGLKISAFRKFFVFDAKTT